MKICWDNLEDIRYIGKARLRKGKNTYFIKICKYCGEECLCAKISTYCTNNCSNADRIVSEETKERMSLAKIGKTFSEEHKRKLGVANTKRIWSKISKQKLSISKKGNTIWKGRIHTESAKIKISKANKGRLAGKNHPNYDKCLSEETKLKISKANKGKYTGENNHNWKGGISYDLYCSAFYDEEYKQSIRDRDGNICISYCKSEKENERKLDVHHIDYDKQNCKPNNLITLCKSCHCKTNHNRDWYTSYYQAMLTRRYDYKY